jgi:hypothetical protein
VVDAAPATAGTSARRFPRTSVIAEEVRRQSGQMFPTPAREAMRDARTTHPDAGTVWASRSAAAPKQLSARKVAALSDTQNSPAARSDRIHAGRSS